MYKQGNLPIYGKMPYLSKLQTNRLPIISNHLNIKLPQHLQFRYFQHIELVQYVMKLHLHPKFIFRTPRFSQIENIQHCWDELKEAIAESSQEFYELIKNVEAEKINSLPDNVQQTLWKYFNRSKNRSTPFGTLATVGIANIQENERENTSIRINHDLNIYRFSDWRAKGKVEYDFDKLKESNSQLFTNSTYYFLKDDIRYIAFEDGKFRIAEMQPDRFVLPILRHCSAPVPLDSAIELLLQMGMRYPEAEECLISLISLQLLFTSFDPNITGEDYFRRIGLMENPIDKEYIISSRDHISGTYNPHNLKYIPDMVDFLRRYLPQQISPTLQQFIQRFKSKFEDQEIPLMWALDPELGVGYGDLETSYETDQLIIDLATRRTDSLQDSNPFKQLLENHFSVGPDTRTTIRLDQLKVDHKAQQQPLPNTFSALFTESDNTIFMEHIGGATATALAGRFTLANAEITQYARELAVIEQDANPNILFFDIAYTCESDVDNVNRRAHIYDYQLSIFNFDTSSHPITADDILISLKGDQLILRSGKLNKRLVPRLASAYNHSRSDLPVFRLLCDLQFQGLTSNLQVRIEDLFPDCSYYPRIQYRNIVLSPQKWRINREAMPWETPEDLKDYLEQQKITRCIRSGVGDQVLYFDTADPSDIRALYHYSKQKTTVLLEESFTTSPGLVIDQQDRSYSAQFLISMLHHDRVYSPVHHYNLPTSEQRSFLPGSEWLYFEIFCHPLRADELLCGIVADFIALHRASIKQWFFIRYDEGGSHLRLRLQLLHPEDSTILSVALCQFLEDDYAAGLISDIRIRIYKRELERYGADMIEAVEQHFCTDSVEVANLILQGLTQEQQYAWCIDLLHQVLDFQLSGMGSVQYFKDTILHALEIEHHLKPAEYVQINQRFRAYLTEGQGQPAAHNNQSLSQSFYIVLSKCPAHRRNKLFMDLFHMHVNRLFPIHQRTHEMLIYYFLDKLSKKAIYKK